MKRLLVMVVGVALTGLLLLPAQAAEKLVVKDGLGATRFVVDDQGRVGIDTITPQEKIDLANGFLTVNGADTTAGTGPGMRKPSVGWTENGRMIVGYGGAGGANVEIYSKGHLTRPGEFYFVYGGAAATGKIKFAHYDGASWNTRMTILDNGYIGIGTETPANPVQHSNGAYLSTGGVWMDASSREYKENIKTLTADAAFTALKGIEPVTFNYKADREETHAGFIAEDVPDIVATKDRKSLSPMDIVAVLTKVVQEQNKTIEALSAKVRMLENLSSK